MTDCPDPFVLTCLILFCVKAVSRRKKKKKILKTLQLFRNHRQKKKNYKLPDLQVGAPATMLAVKAGVGTRGVVSPQICTVHPCVAPVPAYDGRGAVAMCGLFSDGKMQYASRMAVNSLEGAAEACSPTLKSGGHKWWSSASRSCHPNPSRFAFWPPLVLWTPAGKAMLSVSPLPVRFQA